MELSQQNSLPQRIQTRRKSSWDFPSSPLYEDGADERSYSCNSMCAIILVTAVIIFVIGIAIVTMGFTTAATIAG